MSTTILQTKLFIPSTHAECMPRPHLLAKLDSGLPGKLTLVCAPAGFGKTTLVVDWITRLREAADGSDGARPRCCWVSLDDDDNQLARFFTYLLAALQRVEQGWGETARSLLSAPQPPTGRQLITLLLNDLALSRHQAPLLLVLDDYHVIRNQEIHQALTFLLERAPPSFHLVVTTRSDPPLPLAQMRVRREMNEIREAELQFTPGETTSFLNQLQGVQLPEEQVNILANRTEGWIAALQLAALALRGQSDDEQAEFVASFGGGHKHVVDYLLDQVWRQQPEDVQAFLLATSILEQLSGSLCDALTGREDGEQMLADLYHRNLFLTPLDDEHRWYRYHRLFADMLRARATGQGADTIRQRHQQATRWYEAQGKLPGAIHHALAAEDLSGATRLIDLATGPALRHGNTSAIRGWLDALPDAHVRAHPHLALAAAWVAYLNGEVDSAAAYVAAAQARWPAAGEPAPALSLLSLQALLAVLRGDHERAIALAEAALAQAPAGQHSLHGLLLLNLMQAQAAVGAVDAAVETGYKAMRAGIDEDSAFLDATIQDGLLQLLLLQGKFREAINRGEEMAGRLVDSRHRPLPAAGQLYITLGQAYLERGDADRARTETRRGIELSERLAATVAVNLGNLSLARIETARGRHDVALALLDEVQRVYEPVPMQLFAAALVARIRLRQGDAAAALAWANRAPLPPWDVRNFGLETVYLAYARCLLAGQRWAEADTLLAGMATAARGHRRLGSLVPILLTQVLSQQAQENVETAKEILREALQLALAEGHRRPFLEALPQVAPLLQASRETAPSFVASLLAHVDSPAPLAERETLPEPLSEREIEILRLVEAHLSNPEIASQLYLSVNTVKWYFKQIFQKLAVSSRHEAAARARDLGIL